MVNMSSASHFYPLEQAIHAAGLDLYLVPMVDEFQGEYIPAYAARLPYVTGFTGSAGLGVFWGAPSNEKRHTLFVDGRYTLQAANEVDTDKVTIINSGDVSFLQWLEGLNEQKLRVGIDPWLLTMQQYSQWKKLAARAHITWVMERPNWVDHIWSGQPAVPQGQVILHPLEHAGKSYMEKREALIGAMRRHKAEALVLTMPDAINWLLNIRGSDIPYNPLLLSYFVLTRKGEGILYAYPHPWNEEVKTYFADHEVSLGMVEDIFKFVPPKLPLGAKVMMDASSTPYGWQVLAEKAGWDIIRADDPTQLPKAIKNTVELYGIRDAHRRDGLALTRFLFWLDQQVAANKNPDELQVVDTLEKFRALDATYRGPSFATIAGSGPHGAIIHYRADAKSNRTAHSGELLLLDSGGQYPGGTTDVTRTIAVGAPTHIMKEHFTRVLKGHIALARVCFPAGTSGGQLDVLARQYLWAAGLDFDHGTGHGVGAYLCVHEGPQRISKRGSSVALVPGMILSNEPGYYAEGQYGIRIENLVAVIEAEGPAARPMRAFETLTLVPIDMRLIDVSMLTSDERNWLNHYHRRVYDCHAQYLSSEEKSWLVQATRAI